MLRAFSARSRLVVAGCAVALLAVLVAGCQMFLKNFSDHLTRWQMLGQEALGDPLQAVGGYGTVFAPAEESAPLSRAELARATPDVLVAYYAPIFVQQRQPPGEQARRYPPEFDEIGEAQLQRDGKKFKAAVAGPPRVYAIFQKRQIGSQEHVQLTYTAWYPAHPRMRLIDLEEADIDSCVVRVTLDRDNAPLFSETIAACGCFHKVFVQSWLEAEARQAYGPPLKNKRFSVEQTFEDGIDWEVAGVVDEPRDRPARPVVFIKAGDHKVLGVGSASRLRVPERADVRRYQLAHYEELYSVPVAGGPERAPFFDLDDGGKVWGAERKERFLFGWIGVDAAGQPRANDQIKLHFDQSTWDDVTVYQRTLRLPPGVL
jgi:hypothetical protein